VILTFLCTRDDVYFMGFGDVPSEIGRLTDYSFRARIALTPKTDGQHTISLASIGPCKMYIDEVMTLEQSGTFEEKETLFFTYGSGEAITTKYMKAGRTYMIRIDYHSHDRQLNSVLVPLMDPMEDKFQGFRLGFEETSTANYPHEAAELARDCDAAIVVVGRDKEWETEGQDIPIFELPGEQVDLIRQVAATCKRTIVVVQAGTPVCLDPWIDEVQAVLYTWYQGQELGNAALDVISGAVNPTGRLPVTFPRRLQDCPAFSLFPGEQMQSRYAESLYVGYRWWDLVGTEPHFPIGFGLSYTTFEYTPEAISSLALTQDTTFTIKVRVKNAGSYSVPGRETIIVFYTQKNHSRLARPVKQICGFAKSAPLGPSDAQVVEIEVDFRAFGMFDPERAQWVVDSGSRFDILVGTNAQDAKAVWEVVAPVEMTWIM
jgi:beta-glucosidase